jgi:hypothetical protein
MGRSAWRLSAMVAATWSLLVPSAASAELGKNGAPIKTSNYTIDFYEGPILAGARVIGLAGAYAPIAEGVPGYWYNPAAAALRVPWSVDWFDWDLDGGFTLPSSLAGTDFDNNGDTHFENSAAFFLTGGGGLQFGDVGVGTSIDWNRYAIKSPMSGDFHLNEVRAILVAGYGFFKGQLDVGLGAEVHNIQVEQTHGALNDTKLADTFGLAYHLGAIGAPAKLPIRIGAAVRFSPEVVGVAPSGVTADANGNYVVDGIYIPKAISLPTEIDGGIAFQLFRPMNYPFHNPHDEKETFVKQEERKIAAERAARGASAKAPLTADEKKRLAAAKKADHDRRRKPYLLMPRGKILVTTAIRVTAPTKDGVGLESFLRQVVQRSGQEWSFSPRGAIETEAIPGWLIVRGGSYYEPTRFETSSPRVHATGGLDLHVPIFTSLFGLLEDGTSFRVGGALDGTRNYFGWSVTAGLWH